MLSFQNMFLMVVFTQNLKKYMDLGEAVFVDSCVMSQSKLSHSSASRHSKGASRHSVPSRVAENLAGSRSNCILMFFLQQSLIHHCWMLQQCDLKIKWSSLSLHRLLHKLLKLKYFESNLN